MKHVFPSIVLIALSTPLIPASAQSIPPACRIAIDAVEACIGNTIEYLEITNPSEADKLKKAKIPEGLVRHVREEVKQMGDLQVANNCASKEQRVAQFNYISSMVTPLGFSRSLKPACDKAYQRLAQVLQNMD